MLIITVAVDRPAGQAIGIKEEIAMLLERYGDTKVVSIVENEPTQEQISMFGGYGHENKYMQRVRR